MFEIIDPDLLPIPKEYPGLFSPLQVQLHKQLHKNYHQIIVNLLTKNYENTVLPSNLPILIHLLKGHKHAPGQYLYHKLFWENICNEETKIGPLTLKLIESNFQTLDNFKKAFKIIGLNHFSNGWGVASIPMDPTHKNRLNLQTYKDGITPLEHEEYPLIVIDIWEHAYLLDYHTCKHKYFDAILNRINWTTVEKRIEDYEKNMKLLQSLHTLSRELY